MTCDVLKMFGKSPEIKDKLTICVIVTNKTSKQDFNISVGIGSRSHVFLGEFIIIFLTSSAVSGSKEVIQGTTRLIPELNEMNRALGQENLLRMVR